MTCDDFIEDSNYGILLWLDYSQGYNDKKKYTRFAARIQLFAVEIAWNQESYNKAVFSVQKKKNIKELIIEGKICL